MIRKSIIQIGIFGLKIHLKENLVFRTGEVHPLPDFSGCGPTHSSVDPAIGERIQIGSSKIYFIFLLVRVINLSLVLVKKDI